MAELDKALAALVLLEVGHHAIAHLGQARLVGGQRLPPEQHLAAGGAGQRVRDRLIRA